MEFRYLGSSGLKVSEIAYGNWLTHGSQVENEQAKACVRAALDAGITTFDTADVYANTAAETVLGEALDGVRRESVEIMTKAYFPTGPQGPNDTGLSRKHIREAVDGSLRRLRTDYVDVYQGHRLARELHIPFVSNQPQYSMLWRVIEDEVIPASEELGIGQVVFSPIAQGVLTGKYEPGRPPPEGSRATDSDRSGFIGRYLRDDVLTRVRALRPLAEEAGLTLAQLAVAWVLQNRNVSAAIVGASRPEQLADTTKASGVRLDEDLMKRIDETLGDVVERDPGITARHAPKRRLA